MTIVGKTVISSFTYFRLAKELKDRRVWFYSCVRNSFLIFDCSAVSVFLPNATNTLQCIEYKGEDLRRQGIRKKVWWNHFLSMADKSQVSGKNHECAL